MVQADLKERARRLQLGRGSLRDEVRQYLRDAIIQGELKPGEKIAEAALARELGISQAPIREALRELENARLVVNHSRRGTFVRKLTARDAWEMYTLRAELEAMAARLARPRLGSAEFQRLEGFIRDMVEAGRAKQHEQFTQHDVAFHELICERSGHELLLSTWRSINPLNWTAITVATLKNRDLLDLAARHDVIVEALRGSGDVEAVMHDHVLALGLEVTRDLEASEARQTDLAVTGGKSHE